jgi:hypothetical protein
MRPSPEARKQKTKKAIADKNMAKFFPQGENVTLTYTSARAFQLPMTNQQQITQREAIS